VRARFRSRYGASAGHLLLIIASLLIAGAAVLGWTQRPRDLVGVLIWFGAAIVLHDLVFLPIYSLVDRLTLGRLPARAAGYVRVPLLISGMLLLILFPTILGFGAATFHHASGLHEHGYLERWLALSGALCLLSGLAYAVSAHRR
jgi:hypothetical protein